MSAYLPQSLQQLIDEFSRLPGIGPKSAERLAIHLLQSPREQRESLGKTVLEFSNNLQFCETCWNVSNENPCKICRDLLREQNMLCVVEQIIDVWAIEKTGAYQGLYHVLHGVLSPIDGVGPEQLKLNELESRVKKEKFAEIILSLNPSVEGEATSIYIQKMLQPYGVKLTKIARGLPMGGELNYADEVTLMQALQGRREV